MDPSSVTGSQSSTVIQSSSRRRVLFSLVSATVLETGFHSADNYALDTLLQMLQGFITELSHQAKLICEHAGRTEPLPGDVILALIEMGFDVKSLANYALRINRIIVPPPTQQSKPVPPKLLQTGKINELYKYIPDYYPSFPDSHSYISTPTFKQPITEYETLREKSSVQKRDVERGLTRFMARTFTSSYCYSLFPEEQHQLLFPLIGIKTDPVPYLSALLPKDQIWEEESESANKAVDNQAQISDENKETGQQEGDIVDNAYLRPAKVVSNYGIEF